MDEHAMYLREQAAKYRKLAEERKYSADHHEELLELADACEHVAAQIEDRSPSG
jgi:hypothetical protein